MARVVFDRSHDIHTSSVAHPASYPVGIRYTFPKDKAVGA